MRKLSLKELNRVSVEQFKAQEKAPIVLVLDNIRSALNVGSAFRTADAFALEKICLCGITATPPHREILKTAIGATESVEWVYEKEVVQAISQLRGQGYRVLAVEQADRRTLLQDVQVEEGQKYALVFGNEVEGVSETAMSLVDGCVEVPQFGTKHSLNISVCLGIVVWEFFRRWKYD
ncbi:MAG: RNA methyltransferase [Lewinellaceae bacterium]|nr:RNA methyltransferase [Phaeodactylibacter sp.]MCB9035049.1 RNA methyltransferase [Lewinellaceae bacterium]